MNSVSKGKIVSGAQYARPLADRMRPERISEIVGQEALLGENGVLLRAVRAGHIPSMILWGPPGCGKTTLARAFALETNASFVPMTAIGTGVRDVRKVIDDARARKEGTVLFIDEIHRYTKAQQDALLPAVESGVVTLIGATTENPSFEVVGALLSRCRVFVLEMLSEDAITKIIHAALSDVKRGFGAEDIECDEDAVSVLARAAQGDARVALNALELAVSALRKSAGGKIVLRAQDCIEALRKPILYDKEGEEHYSVISALHKSMRGGNADAALYYLARMLEGGEDPLFVARRLIRFASEDVGIANSFALPQTIAAFDACHRIGMPECSVNLAQAVVYLSKSKKSNALYVAYNLAREDVRALGALPVPLHLRNAPTKLMENLGFGHGYKYTPDFEKPEEAEQEFFPDALVGRRYLPR